MVAAAPARVVASVAAAAARVGLERSSPDQDPCASVDAPGAAVAAPPGVVAAEAVAAEVRQHVHPALAVVLVLLHVQPAAPAVDAVAARHVFAAAQHVAVPARHVAVRVAYRRPVVVVVQHEAVAAAVQPEQALAMFAAQHLDPGPDLVARHEP